MLQKLKSYINNRRWDDPIALLRSKWSEVPLKDGRIESKELLRLTDQELLALWLDDRNFLTTGSQFDHRGWYHEFYCDGMRDKKVLDVGCGLAIDSITFCEHGAAVTFVDIVPENLQVVERICKIMNLKSVDFLLLENISSLKALTKDYDVITALGSLHHAPAEFIKLEAQELLNHLKIGGRWLQLAYPKTRWEREGKLPFEKWGIRTDGEAPWTEWYDLPKLLQLLEPARFDVVLCREFHDHEFIWFDLIYRGRESQ